jgi:hypothetical protein
MQVIWDEGVFDDFRKNLNLRPAVPRNWAVGFIGCPVGSWGRRGGFRQIILYQKREKWLSWILLRSER